MAGSENQGKGTASSEPFAEWCAQQEGINLGVKAAFDQADRPYVVAWNDRLTYTGRGDFAAAAAELLVVKSMKSGTRSEP